MLTSDLVMFIVLTLVVFGMYTYCGYLFHKNKVSWLTFSALTGILIGGLYSIGTMM